MNRNCVKRLAFILLIGSLCFPTDVFACRHGRHLSCSVGSNESARVYKHVTRHGGVRKGKKKTVKNVSAAFKDSLPDTKSNIRAEGKAATILWREKDRQMLSWLTFVTPDRQIPVTGTVCGSVSLNRDNAPKGKHPYRDLNTAVCSKINAVISSLEGLSGTTVTSVQVTGYSAPAGSTLKSEKIALQRLFSLKEALEENRVSGKIPVQAGWTAEDWDSLSVLVRHSDMPLRDAVTGVIESTDPANGRERVLARLDGGVPYAYMRERLYAKVERIKYAVTYRQRESGSEEAAAESTCTGGITLASLCATAQSFAKDSKEFSDLTDLGARLFPDSPQANINAGAVALLHKDTVRARKYLERYATRKEALGNMGILCLLEGNRDKAELYLQMAAASGSPQAHKVLEYMQK